MQAGQQMAEVVDAYVYNFLRTTSSTDKVPGATLINNTDTAILTETPNDASIDLTDLDDPSISSSDYQSAGGTLLNSLLSAQRNLSQVGQLDDQMCWVVGGPQTTSALTRMAFAHGGSALEMQGERTRQNGYMGMLSGMRYMESRLAYNSTNGEDILVGTGRTFAFASRLGEVEMLRDPNTHGTLIRMLLQFGAVIIDAGSLYQIRQKYTGEMSGSVVS